MNNGSGREWKNSLGKWMMPLFFYMLMVVDENSILNSPVFDKEYMNRKKEKELLDYLYNGELDVKKEGVNNVSSVNSNSVSDINSLD